MCGGVEEVSVWVRRWVCVWVRRCVGEEVGVCVGEVGVIPHMGIPPGLEAP